MVLCEYPDTEKRVTLSLMAFLGDTQLECRRFLSVLPQLFVGNVCLESQNLPPTIKGRGTNIKYLFSTSYGVATLVRIFPFVSWAGGNDILKGV